MRGIPSGDGNPDEAAPKTVGGRSRSRPSRHGQEAPGICIGCRAGGVLRVDDWLRALVGRIGGGLEETVMGV